MPTQNSTFQLFVLGDLSSDKELQTLTIFAEFRNSRVIERVQLNYPEIKKELTDKIAKLRGFIEAGYPVFDELALKQLGGKLFDLIIQNNVKRLFDKATGTEAEILVLEIFVEDYTIASWPWEYLYDSVSSTFLCQEFHPISRGLFTIFPEGFKNTQSDKIRILLVIGVLADDPNTTPEEEIKWIQEVFRSHIKTGKVELTIKQDIKAIELELELQKNQYDILHFFGHAGLDPQKKEGYLRLDNSQGNSFKLFANTFGNLLAKQGIRLVFLNACETAKAAQNENPARSSVAAALLGRGIPAVISTQFSMPDTTSHYLSSVIYSALANGKTLGNALRDGRRAMSYDTNFQIFDWGIPVLYCSNPNIVIFSYTQIESEKDEEQPQRINPEPTSIIDFDKNNNVHINVTQGFQCGNHALQHNIFQYGDIVYDSLSNTKVKVAVIDIDSKAGYLPELIGLANQVQEYYSFEVAYLPIPSNAVRTNIGDSTLPQLYLPLLDQSLSKATESLNVDLVCCLTRHLIAFESSGEYHYNYFSATWTSKNKVSFVSTYSMREYAAQANLEFAKAIFQLCLSILLVSEDRWGLKFHKETYGCLFDYCRKRNDVVKQWEHRKFDHQACRSKIKDPKQLKAIDALMGL